MRLVHTILAAAVVASAFANGVTVAVEIPASPVAYTTSGTPAVDTTATNDLRAASDAERRSAGLEPLFTRSTYLSAATRIATQLTQNQSPSYPSDEAPISYLGGTATEDSYEYMVAQAIDSVVYVAHNVLAYPLHTDGGWAVVTRMRGDGLVAWGVALVVGWPDPNIGATSGCSTSGYCWSNGGLNPHLPWTRNVVKWYLSTSHLPSAGESLVKAAIANVNKVSRFGADLRYGGKTTDTTPTAAHRFLIVFGSCGSASALACTTTGTQGTYALVYQAKTVVSSARYASNPTSSWWIGTLMHEIAHGTGLDHYNGTYAGSYQLMRWANGPDVIRSGDANGLRRIAPAGRLSASVSWRRSDGLLTVRTAGSGLGGIRSITTQCTDWSGAWRTVKTLAGAYDIRSYARSAGAYKLNAGIVRRCRAIVRSKVATYTSATITISG